jgi:periplasmic protein CpxP/Spy
MKLSKLVIITVIVLGGIAAFNTQAQDTPKSEAKPEAKRPGVVRARIDSELNLTPEQKTKWQAAMKEQAEQAKALRDDTSLTPAQRREKIKALHEEMQAKLKEILTPEQQEKLKTLREERAPKRPAKPQAN